jgi:uncharacterized protein (DUF427 family)
MTPPENHDRITMKVNPHRVRVMFENHVIADSADVIVLSESGLRPVQYFPREDVAMEYTGKTDKHSHCPYKGDASYYSIVMEGVIAENVIWSYEDPMAGMEAIRGRIAFYPDKLEIYELADAAMDSIPIDRATD